MELNKFKIINLIFRIGYKSGKRNANLSTLYFVEIIYHCVKHRSGNVLNKQNLQGVDSQRVV